MRSGAQSPTVGFVGMTHLGLVSAAAGAERGFDIVAFDPDSALIARIGAGTLPVLEPDLDALVDRNRQLLTFTSDAEALSRCDLVYVAPDVATDNHGRSDLSTIEHLLAVTFEATRQETVIVVLSQVPPGFTRAHRRPGRILVYQVETLIFGRAVERALNPERTIIGLDDPAGVLPQVYRTYLEGHGNPPLLPMRYESAELAKISINCCLVSSIAVANTLAELCERIGADWSEIAPALKLDRRIGLYSYLTPGLGIAGGNLERDLATVRRLSAEFTTESNVIAAWLENSEHRRNWAYDVLDAELLRRTGSPRIAVLGLAYKENTHSVKNSAAIALVERLVSTQVAVHDPVVSAGIVPRARGAASVLDCVEGADAVAVMTPWPQFKAHDPAAIAASMRGRLMLDPYRLFSGAAAVASGLDYFTLGAPPMRARGQRHA
jgi:UDPglucose 6-dehydrogenase